MVGLFYSSRAITDRCILGISELQIIERSMNYHTPPFINNFLQDPQSHPYLRLIISLNSDPGLFTVALVS